MTPLPRAPGSNKKLEFEGRGHRRQYLIGALFRRGPASCRSRPRLPSAPGWSSAGRDRAAGAEWYLFAGAAQEFGFYASDDDLDPEDNSPAWQPITTRLCDATVGGRNPVLDLNPGPAALPTPRFLSPATAPPPTRNPWQRQRRGRAGGPLPGSTSSASPTSPRWTTRRRAAVPPRRTNRGSTFAVDFILRPPAHAARPVRPGSRLAPPDLSGTSRATTMPSSATTIGTAGSAGCATGTRRVAAGPRPVRLKFRVRVVSGRRRWARDVRRELRLPPAGRPARRRLRPAWSEARAGTAAARIPASATSSTARPTPGATPRTEASALRSATASAPAATTAAPTR